MRSPCSVLEPSILHIARFSLTKLETRGNTRQFHAIQRTARDCCLQEAHEVTSEAALDRRKGIGTQWKGRSRHTPTQPVTKSTKGLDLFDVTAQGGHRGN